MAARNKPSPFSVASEQYSTYLRAVQVEISGTEQRNARRARSNAGHPLWARAFDSQWQRFICKTSVTTTVH